MALTSMEKSLCNSLEQKFSPIATTVQNTRSGFRNVVADFSAGLRSRKGQFTNPLDVTAAVVDLQAQTQEVLPGDSLEDMDRLKTFIAGCEFFSDSNPVGVLFGGTLGIFGKIDGFIDALSGTIPEIGLGKLADTLNRLLSEVTIPGGNIISDLLGQLDQLINCAQYLCPGYNNWTLVAEQEVDNLYDDFNVVKNPLDPNFGKFDFTSVYTDVGLNPTEIMSMDIANNGITTIKNGASSAITSAVSKAKSLIGSGGFF